MIGEPENDIIFWDSSESSKESIVDIDINNEFENKIECGENSVSFEFTDNSVEISESLDSTIESDNSIAADGVYEKKYYKISEVESMIGESQSTIRFWEDSFAELGKNFCSQRSRGGTRKFTKENIDNLKLLKILLRERRLTIEGAISEIKNERKRNAKERALILLMEARNELNDLIDAYNCVLHQNVN